MKCIIISKNEFTLNQHNKRIKSASFVGPLLLRQPLHLNANMVVLFFVYICTHVIKENAKLRLCDTAMISKV